jgi:hypothetical protein
MNITSLEQLCIHQPEWNQRLEELQTAQSLSAMVWIALQMGLLVARLLVESTLLDRAKKPVPWGECPRCGHRLQSKGWQPRQLETVVGTIH